MWFLYLNGGDACVWHDTTVHVTGEIGTSFSVNRGKKKGRRPTLTVPDDL